MLSRKNEEETLPKEKDDPKSDHRRSVSENRKPQRPSTCPTKTPSNQKRSLLQTAYLTEPIAEALVSGALTTHPLRLISNLPGTNVHARPQPAWPEFSRQAFWRPAFALRIRSQLC